MARSVLVQYAHPYPIRSRVNTRLKAAITSIDGLTVNDLYHRYPEMHIAVAEEQALLRDTDLLVFMHPLYWYSAPALLKEWQDTVLEYGFAYGAGGDALHGKSFMSVVTTGGEADSYRDDGRNGRSLEVLLEPFRQTAAFCGMQTVEPFVVHGTNTIEDNEIDAAATRLHDHFVAWINA